MGVPALLLLFCLGEEVLGLCAFCASHKVRRGSESLLFIFPRSVPWRVQGCASSANPATLRWLLISVCCLKKLTHATYGGSHISNLWGASNRGTCRGGVVYRLAVGISRWGNPMNFVHRLFGGVCESVNRISFLRSMCYLLWTFFNATSLPT